MNARASLESREWAARSSQIPFSIGLVTFAILALELALIRWTSSQVRVFAYFNNIVLVSAFLGIGLGVTLGRKNPGLIHFALPVLLVAAVPIAMAEPWNLVNLQFPDQSVMLWGSQTLPSNAWVFARNIALFIALLGLIIATFAMYGAPLGYLFGRTAALQAYSADLLGSLLGVLAFTVAAWLDAGPAVWFALAVLPIAWLSRRPLSIGAAVVVVALAQFSVGGAVFSPYNRIDLVPFLGSGYDLRVNRDFHQYMFDFSDANIQDARISDADRQARRNVRDAYDLPFSLNPHRASALVVGAGTGNDVQAALRSGYAHVTSVDIDGRIIDIGRRLHPEHPYHNPSVETVVDDARAFFEKDRDRKYDVVCFGLLDSHAMSSAMSTLRLDNYVYTEEGIRAAWKRVAPGGHLSLALSCMAGRWFYERLHWTITRATGSEPIDYYSSLHGGMVTFVVGRPGATLATPPSGPVVLHPTMPQARTLTTSDDWPFLYMRPGVVPWGYITVLSCLLLFAAFSVRLVFSRQKGNGRWFHWPLFLMGAAFLLIETRGVTSLSLLFGSTWVVNSAVFAGILVMVLAANSVVRARQWTDPTPWFVALIGATLLLYFFPLAWLQTLPLFARGVLGGLLTGLPVGLAGIIVPMLLARATDPAAALGANLVGAVLGGCLEYFSMYTGLRAMALLALVLYLVAYALVRRMTAGEAAAVTAPAAAMVEG